MFCASYVRGQATRGPRQAEAAFYACRASLGFLRKQTVRQGNLRLLLDMLKGQAGKHILGNDNSPYNGPEQATDAIPISGPMQRAAARAC